VNAGLNRFHFSCGSRFGKYSGDSGARGFLEKPCIELTPAITGASAWGICGSLELAKWSTPLTEILVDLRVMKRLQHLRGSAGKFDHRVTLAKSGPPGIRVCDLKPCGDRLDVLIAGAKLPARTRPG